MSTNNDFAALGSALYGYLGTACTVPVYYALASQGGTPPYAIIQRQSAVDEYTFTDSGVSTEYTIRVVSNRVWPGEAYLVYGSLHSVLENAPLLATGFTVLRCRRRSTIEYREPSGYWNVGGIYRIDLWESQ